jgi:uncharacterized protein (TIGR02117 family)
MPRPLRALFAVVLVVCALLVGCSAEPRRVAEQRSAVIYVIKRNWHVDIGFAAADLQAPLASLRADFPGAGYLLFGFGDRHYLLDRDRGFGGMFAAFWPGAGVMLATGLTASAQAAFGADNVIEVQVSAAQARKLQQFVWQSLSADGGAVRPLRAGPYQGSVYYAASQRYSALHTCNTWAAEALRESGLPIHSHGVALSGQLWIQVQRLVGPQ